MKVSVGHDGLTDEDSPAGVQHCLAPWAQPKPWSPPRPACRGDWDMLTHPGGPCPFTRHPEEPFLGRPGFMGEPGQASQVRNWGFKSDRRRVRSAPATRLQPGPSGLGSPGRAMLSAGLLPDHPPAPLFVQLDTTCHQWLPREPGGGVAPRRSEHNCPCSQRPSTPLLSASL